MLSFEVLPQYVRFTAASEQFPDGRVYPLHRIQQLLRDEFDQLPTCTLLTAPTGTGKSYAFPFPVLRDRSSGTASFYRSLVKGLIVLPTNALIQELTAQFQQAYPQLTTTCLNGPALDAQEKKGFQRFEAMLDIADRSDLVITNPDLLIYAMQGGYHQGRARRIRTYEQQQGKKVRRGQETGRRNPQNFLECFSYVIFDEYHLYDASQIAQVLTLLMLRDAYLGVNQPIRFLFASATPEPALGVWLEKLGYTCQEIIESIVASPQAARAIHGALQVHCHSGTAMAPWLEERMPELMDALDQGQRALVIFDQLHVLQAFGRQLARSHPHLRVYESTGYTPKDEDSQPLIRQAQLILATNKAEVGVNYGVTYCLMQPGAYFQHFVQRFGRVARGDQQGTIHLLLDAVAHRKLQRAAVPAQLDYYAFLDLMRGVMQARKFYTETVPEHLGEHLWCIRRLIWENQDYHSHQPLQQLMEASFWQHPSLGPARARYLVMQRVHEGIQAVVQRGFPDAFDSRSAFYLDWFLATYQQKATHPAYQWAAWWHTYLQTYLRFREGSHVVELYDQERDQVLDYRLEWVLQYRQILGIEQRETAGYTCQRYIVGGEKERDRDLQYHVDTIPWIGEKSNELLTYEQVNRPDALERAFRQGVAAIQRRHAYGIQPLDEPIRALLPLLLDLGKTFSRKRLNIKAIYHNDALL